MARRGTLTGTQVAALVAVVLVAFGMAIYMTRDRKTPENCHYVGAIEQCATPTTTEPDPLDSVLPDDDLLGDGSS
jgi:hypothetical protein